MASIDVVRAHLVAGGYPPGAPAGHDFDFARLRLLELLAERPEARVTVANDYRDIERWLPDCRLLLTYVAGPFPDDAQNEAIRGWLERGGRWLALHGTAGGKAVRVQRDGAARKQMVRTAHHDTLGGFFLNHPPVRRFEVRVNAPGHPLAAGLPESFETTDELYLVEILHPQECTPLLTTELENDPSPPGFGFVYDRDTARAPDGRTRVLGYTRRLGRGEVAYVALGHCHSPGSNSQPFVDESVARGGETPTRLRGSWDTPAFIGLLRNAIDWALRG